MTNKNETPQPAFLVALLPFAVMGTAIYFSVFVYEAEPHIALFFGAITASLAAYGTGFTWGTIRSAFERNIQKGLITMIILMIIGMLIGTWIASGIVPAMLYFGIQFLHPLAFLPLILLFCAVMSVMTGSSWVTIGTIGVAAVGIGQGLGIPAAITAGAIVSGSFFGDKISPLSDSTNLASSVFEVNIYDHIRHMLYSTLPALGLSLIAYTVIGFFLTETGSSGEEAMQYQEYILEHFTLSPLLLVPPVAVIFLILKRVPAIPSLVAGVVLASLTQVLVQGANLGDLMITLYDGFFISSGWDTMDTLLSRGGLASMYSIIGLTLLALTFGGIMRYCGMLEAIVLKMKRLVRRRGGLVLTTLLSSVFVNLFTANQYLSVIIPGQMYEQSYERLSLKKKNLTRTLEAGGTLTSPLIPWNASAIFVSAVLGIGALQYAPYAFVCWSTGLVVALYGFSGLTMEKEDPREND